MTLSVKTKSQRTRDASAGRSPDGKTAAAPRPRLIGYARVSTDEQNLDLQRNALRNAGCTPLFEDQGISGSVSTRPGLDGALAALRPGDNLVVWRLDRLGRSLMHLVWLIDSLDARGIGVRSLTESFAADSSSGRLIFHVMAALAEFERSLISERTRAGLAAARARGAQLGRPRRFSAQTRAAAKRSVQRGRSINEVARTYGMHPRTLYRILREADPSAG